MIKYLYVLLGLFFTLIPAHSQNLVPNPSFEDFKKEPCLARFRTGQDAISDYVREWYLPTKGTADVWKTDSSGKDTCIIFTYTGLKAHTGNYVAGLFTLYRYDTIHYKFNVNHENSSAFLAAIDNREYFQVKLGASLTVGKVYHAEMFAARNGNSNFQTSNLGMLFSTDPLVKPSTTLLLTSIQPQVVDTTVIADSTWRKVSGTFVADKAYRYLTLGNFADDAHTQIELAGPNKVYSPGAYYYLDDVSVEEVRDAPLVTVPNLGVDTTLCPGQSLRLQLSDLPQTRYRWEDGSTILSRQITQSGTYYVTATTGGYSVTDTLHVTVLPPVSLPRDSVLCRGETLLLAPGYPLRPLMWSDGSTDSALTVFETGQYAVSVSDRYCAISDTIEVEFIECPGEVPNVFTPNGDGRNDAFVIDNIGLRPWQFTVYNRWGVRVFASHAYRNDWWGDDLPAGTYFYELYNQSLRRKRKGWVKILR